MSKKEKLIFPDFNLVVCSKKSITISEAENQYRKLLLESGFEYNVLYANKLLEMKNMLKPRHLSSVKKDFEELIHHLDSWKRKKGYKFPIAFQRRKKSDVKCHNKIRLFLTDQYINGEDVTLDSILDTIGIRIIPSLGNVDTQESIEFCYKILEETVNFFTLKKGYNPHKAEKMLNLGFVPEKHPDVIIPKHADKLIKDHYKIYVKDYYAKPKKDDGYQSLHIVFDGSICPIEVQIRTFATHCRIDNSHSDYEDQRYSGNFDKINLEREKVNIAGYFYDKNNDQIYDLVGLENSIDPFNQIY